MASPGNGFIFVYSINNREDFDALNACVEEVVRAKKLSGIAELPCVLFANKADLEAERQVLQPVL